ncbi:MAG: glycerol-3-phosphate responsive antiterminator [Firmicutes bacterium]|nr:glycerol-3-phosphate responsive antiterminator [Bacillota bacterium]
MSILEQIRESPIIAAVRDTRALGRALESPIRVVFLLTGDINGAEEITTAVRKAGKAVLVHLDLMEGLGKDRAAIKFVAGVIRPDGVITTRANLIGAARGEGLFTVQRVFMLDSQSFQTAVATVRGTGPDAVECLPGIIPRVIGELARAMPVPIVAGGLVKTVDEIQNALRAGAAGVSVSNADLWYHVGVGRDPGPTLLRRS